jgi:UTP:GlnB (protein PII) uridylyltransferase
MDTIAILALGGYGRGELCPYSDIDVMVLCETGSLLEQARAAASAVLHFLWDAGVDVGHSVRTIEESIGLHGTTFDSWASMIESRFICGNESLARDLYARMREKIAGAPPGWFVECVFQDVNARHERFGTSVKLLEPNIKKSAGGLRDIHAAFWLYRGTDVRYFIPADGVNSATKGFLGILRDEGRLEPEEHAAALRAFEYMLRVRHEMHFRRESQHDTLEYALQREVAEGIGVAPGPGLMSVEVFMRGYYIHATGSSSARASSSGNRSSLPDPPGRQGRAWAPRSYSTTTRWRSTRPSRRSPEQNRCLKLSLWRPNTRWGPTCGCAGFSRGARISSVRRMRIPPCSPRISAAYSGRTASRKRCTR